MATSPLKINRRSANITEGKSRAPNRSMYYAMGYQEGDFPISEKVSNEVLSLPIHPELTEEQIQYVAKHVVAFQKSHTPEPTYQR